MMTIWEYFRTDDFKKKCEEIQKEYQRLEVELFLYDLTKRISEVIVNERIRKD